MKNNQKGILQTRGFTLIELLIVIGVISILAGLVLVAVNPAQQFGKANDSERKSELSSIIKAVFQYQTSPTARGALPRCMFGAVPALTDIPECDTDSSGIGFGNGGFEGAAKLGSPADATTFDCSTILVPSYLRSIPVDPNSNYDSTDTGYYLCQDTSGANPKIYTIAVGAEVFTDDGGCEVPGTVTQTMCISG